MQLISGIQCSSEVIQYFKELLKKRQYRYIIYRIPSGGHTTDITVEKASKRNANFSDFVQDLPKNEARYAVYDFSYITPDWGVKDSMLFIYWTPCLLSHTRYRTMYASTKVTILEQLRQITHLKNVDVTDPEDLTEPNMLKALLPMREKGIDLGLRLGVSQNGKTMA